MEKKCKYCAMMIPKEAKVCPHCRKNQGTSVFVWIVAIFFCFMGIGMCQSMIATINNVDNKSAVINNSLVPDVIKNEPVLELQKWGWHKEYDYAIAEGAVKNISSEPIDNVVAVLQIYDKQGNFIKADDALIDYRPVLPGQTSPFKVMASYNPEMKSAIIEFKTFSGGTLNWKEKEGKKK